MKKLLLNIIILLSATISNAQQDLMLSQYMMNGLFLNPAYSGSHDFAGATLTYRNQWTNFDGAPKSLVFGIDGKLFGDKHGFGLTASNDRIGIIRQTEVNGNYAFHIPTGKGHLSTGLKFGASFYKEDLSMAILTNPADPIYAAGTNKFAIPKAGIGIYYYLEKAYAGFSIPSLIGYDSRNNFNANIETATLLKRHYYLYGGYVFGKDESAIKIKPSLLLKYEKAAPLEADINLNAWFNDVFSVGISYRTNDAVVVMAEFILSKQFRLGYAFDITTTEISTVSNGTHEITLGYDFGFKGPERNQNNRYF